MHIGGIFKIREYHPMPFKSTDLCIWDNVIVKQIPISDSELCDSLLLSLRYAFLVTTHFLDLQTIFPTHFSDRLLEEGASLEERVFAY